MPSGPSVGTSPATATWIVTHSPGSMLFATRYVVEAVVPPQSSSVVQSLPGLDDAAEQMSATSHSRALLGSIEQSWLSWKLVPSSLQVPSAAATQSW
jgi:hypothetical protein